MNEYLRLDSSHRELVKDLFTNVKYMGRDDMGSFYRNPTERGEVGEQHYHNFVYTYLSDLHSYVAWGAFSEGRCVGIISAYNSGDDPCWYGTQIRSVGGRTVVRGLLDTMCEYQEARGCYKFYTLWNAHETRTLRRFAFSTRTNERYDYVDEYIVPAKHRCYYTNHWHILFNRVLLPVDTVVRCTFLKRQYRQTLPIGGGL